MTYPIPSWSPNTIYAFYPAILIVAVGLLDLINWRYNGRLRVCCRVTGCTVVCILCLFHLWGDFGTERMNSRWFRGTARREPLEKLEDAPPGKAVYSIESGPDHDRKTRYFTLKDHMHLELVFGLAFAAMAFKYRD